MKKKLTLLLTIFFCLTLINSCATLIKVKVLKPAEINIGNRKKIAIADFSMSGTIKNVYGETTEGYNFSGRSAVANLVAKLIQNGHFTVVERERLNQVMKEQGLAASGFVKASDAIQLGNLTGVEAIIVGSGNYWVEDEIEERENSLDYTDSTVYFRERRKVRNTSVSLTFRIIDTGTGEVIASRSNSDNLISRTVYRTIAGTEKTVKKEPVETTESTNTVNTIVGLTRLAIKGAEIANDINQKATANLSNWNYMVDNILDKLSNKLVKQIAPHYITEEREIRGGGSKEMETGLEYSKRGMWDAAYTEWIKVLNNGSDNDKANAKYNLGIYYETTGNYQVAEQSFGEAYNLLNDELFINSKARVKVRIAELSKLESLGFDVKSVNRTIDNNIDYLKIALQDLRNEEYNKAEQSLKMALKKAPNDSFVHYQLGVVYSKKNDWKAAANNLQEALRINQNYTDAQTLLQEIQNRIETENNNNQVSDNKNVSKNHFSEGVRLYNSGKYTSAILEYRKALAEKPDDFYINNNIGMAYYSNKKYKMAIHYYQKSLKNKPNQPSVHFNLGIAYYLNGQLDKAKQEYKKACDLGYKEACSL